MLRTNFISCLYLLYIVSLYGKKRILLILMTPYSLYDLKLTKRFSLFHLNKFSVIERLRHSSIQNSCENVSIQNLRERLSECCLFALKMFLLHSLIGEILKSRFSFCTLCPYSSLQLYHGQLISSTKTTFLIMCTTRRHSVFIYSFKSIFKRFK